MNAINEKDRDLMFQECYEVSGGTISRVSWDAAWAACERSLLHDLAAGRAAVQAALYEARDVYRDALLNVDSSTRPGFNHGKWSGSDGENDGS